MVLNPVMTGCIGRSGATLTFQRWVLSASKQNINAVAASEYPETYIRPAASTTVLILQWNSREDVPLKDTRAINGSERASWRTDRIVRGPNQDVAIGMQSRGYW